MDKFEEHLKYSTDIEHTRRMKIHGHQFHHDSQIKDRPGELFRVVGKVSGDWTNELYTTRDQGQLAHWGRKDEIYIHPVNDTTPQLNKILEVLQFKRIIASQVQTQKPGDTVVKHLDDFSIFESSPDEKIIRLLITLHDWEAGQYMSFGNTGYQGWQPGEVIYSDFEKIPHATANLSWNPRSIICVTGVVSTFTTEILAYGLGEVAIS